MLARIRHTFQIDPVRAAEASLGGGEAGQTEAGGDRVQPRRELGGAAEVLSLITI